MEKEHKVNITVLLRAESRAPPGVGIKINRFGISYFWVFWVNDQIRTGNRYFRGL